MQARKTAAQAEGRVVWEFGVGAARSNLSKGFPNRLKIQGFQVIMGTDFFQFWSMMAQYLLPVFTYRGWWKTAPE